MCIRFMAVNLVPSTELVFNTCFGLSCTEKNFMGRLVEQRPVEQMLTFLFCCPDFISPLFIHLMSPY